MLVHIIVLVHIPLDLEQCTLDPLLHSIVGYSKAKK